MTAGKTLTKIILSGALIIGLCGGIPGCLNNYKHTFNGKIGEEQVKFDKHPFGRYNIIEVKKADGSKIKYVDADDDLKLERIKITADDYNSNYYAISSNPAVMEIVEKSQKEFDDYLKKIEEIQRASLNKK